MQFCEICGYKKKGMTTNFFSPLSFVAVFGSGIRDPKIYCSNHSAAAATYLVTLTWSRNLITHLITHNLITEPHLPLSSFPPFNHAAPSSSPTSSAPPFRAVSPFSWVESYLASVALFYLFFCEHVPGRWCGAICPESWSCPCLRGPARTPREHAARLSYACVRSPLFSAQHGEIQYDINTRYQCFGSGFIQVRGQK